MKHYDCLVPGCTWHSQADDESELVRRAVEHLREAHDETAVRPEMIERIKQRVYEKKLAG